jgi:hypothetical protein
MNKTIQQTLQNRKALIRLTSGLTVEQFNQVPEGFNNNIYWNLCHIISIQQLLVYGSSGNQFTVDSEFVLNYRNGTFPHELADEQKINELREMLSTTLLACQVDLEAGKFTEMKAFDTRIKTRLENIDDFLNFNLFHEGVHTGIVLNFVKLFA